MGRLLYLEDNATHNFITLGKYYCNRNIQTIYKYTIITIEPSPSDFGRKVNTNIIRSDATYFLTISSAPQDGATITSHHNLQHNKFCSN